MLLPKACRIAAKMSKHIVLALLSILSIVGVQCHGDQQGAEGGGNILDKIGDSVNFDNVFDWVFGEEE